MATKSTNLGGDLISDPAMAKLQAVDHVDVFAVGLDHALWTRARIAGNWNDNWQSLGGNLQADYSPAAVSWGSARMDVFALGAEGDLMHTWWDGSWGNGWQSLGHPPKTVPEDVTKGALTSGPAVVSRGPNKLDVFARGADNALWQRTWDGSKWTAWTSLGGSITSAPSAVTVGPDRVEVAARGDGNSIWHITGTGSGSALSWSKWGSLGNAASTVVTVDSPALVSTGPNRLDIFIAEQVTPRGSNIFVTTSPDLLLHKSWNGSTWSDWTTTGVNIGAEDQQPRNANVSPPQLSVLPAARGQFELVDRTIPSLGLNRGPIVDHLF